MQNAEIIRRRQNVILGLVLDQGYTAREVGRELVRTELFQKNGSVDGMDPLWQERFRAPGARTEKVSDLCSQRGIGMVFLGDPDYPPLLARIADPPAMLFFKGNREVLTKESVSIVGARRACPYGKQAAYECAEAAAREGFNVVSGLAVGIDGAAHRGALDAGGRTIAVMAGPADLCYPKCHTWLYRKILENGAVISEYPPDTEIEKWHFVERNRLVSGMSRTVIVAQAGIRSGSLITAGNAAEQGRDVYCVPGSIYDPEYLGSHRLIQDGANILTSIGELFGEPGEWFRQQTIAEIDFLPRRETAAEPAAWEHTKKLREQQRQMAEKAGEWKWLYEAIDDFGTGAQTLAERTGRDPAAVQMGISELEISGLVTHSGSLIVKIREG